MQISVGVHASCSSLLFTAETELEIVSFFFLMLKRLQWFSVSGLLTHSIKCCYNFNTTKLSK